MHTISINDSSIGTNCRPWIIAELSGNHNHSLERALVLVDAAADAGVQAVKIQTYTADTMTLDISSGEFFIDDPDSLWQGKNLYQLYQQAYTPWEWHRPIFDRCRQRGLVGFSTPFDVTAVDFLESLDVPCYKIASFEVPDLPLIHKAASTGKPLIISTGMASLAELEAAVRTARAAGCTDLILLKCTSSYPATPEHSDLRTLPHLAQLFHVQVGLSDHTLGIGVAVGAVALGATVIEKHLTLSRTDGGVDAAFSLEPHELQQLAVETERAHLALGAVHYGLVPGEETSYRHRRSLYIAEDLPAGAVLTAQNLRSIRPGLGLEPKYYDLVLGKTIKKPVRKGTPLSWDLLL